MSDSLRIDVPATDGKPALLTSSGEASPPLVALAVEEARAAWPGVNVVATRRSSTWWSLAVGVGLARGFSIEILGKSGPGPLAATLVLRSSTTLGSVLAVISGAAFAIVGLAGMLYAWFVRGVRGRLAIGVGAALGAAVALPIFGVGWLADHGLNPMRTRSLGPFRDRLAAAIARDFLPVKNR